MPLNPPTAVAVDRARSRQALADSRSRPGSERHPGSPAIAAPRDRTITLALAALGVVYGDIGTSPLYAVRECFNGPHAIELNDTSILGVASLILWSLTVVVSVKYVGW